MIAKADADERPIVLALVGSLWPGNDASGANRSFAGFASALRQEFDIKLLAQAGPAGQRVARPLDAWTDRGTHRVRYLAVRSFGARGLLRVLRNTRYDVLWLNGFFDRNFTIPTLLARAVRLVPRTPVIISPRGEFSDGALGLKSKRKAAWLVFVRAMHLLHDVVIHATSEAERNDIAAANPLAQSYVIAPNLIPPIAMPDRKAQTDGILRLVFVGRISPVKNLDLALSILSRVRGPICFDIVGPAQDADYTAKCRALAGAMPPHIEVRWHGEVPGGRIPDYLARADLLFLPSKSENFGHAIFEALACGTPVLIGQATPWRDLAADGAGYDLPLEKPDMFVDAIEAHARLSFEERASRSTAARARADRSIASSNALALNCAMIHQAIDTARC